MNMVRMPEVTYKIMSAVKSKDTRPELSLRREIWSRGLRYRVNVKTLPGKPDIVFTKAKLAVFCDGDFWHGHNWVIRGLSSLEEELSRYSPFWKDKILGNINRDSVITEKLKSDNWEVIRFWESEIKSNLHKCVDLIITNYKTRIASIHKGKA
jgi:DNA mismatch endonuclease (patch repair protein)